MHASVVHYIRMWWLMLKTIYGPIPLVQQAKINYCIVQNFDRGKFDEFGVRKNRRLNFDELYQPYMQTAIEKENFEW